ncbi:hypothetical protein L3X38_017847 [Prunus dulcis]|uniref:Uncharacterized protein n=1 Tax=Prunus dulcis TaxID=3755 RepID=A0AAD4W8N2_PRUDU|nr:hypothetical protein L3X38_017847 [Prunus dulcis]
MVAARPPQAEPISAVGTYGSASVSPPQPDQSPPWGCPELAGKSCFPTEVRSKLPELPARNSPSFLRQIDRVRYGFSAIFRVLADGYMGFDRF